MFKNIPTAREMAIKQGQEKLEVFVKVALEKVFLVAQRGEYYTSIKSEDVHLPFVKSRLQDEGFKVKYDEETKEISIDWSEATELKSQAYSAYKLASSENKKQKERIIDKLDYALGSSERFIMVIKEYSLSTSIKSELRDKGYEIEEMPISYRISW